jgi:hypothetical protein
MELSGELRAALPEAPAALLAVARAVADLALARAVRGAGRGGRRGVPPGWGRGTTAPLPRAARSRIAAAAGPAAPGPGRRAPRRAGDAPGDNAAAPLLPPPPPFQAAQRDGEVEQLRCELAAAERANADLEARLAEQQRRVRRAQGSAGQAHARAPARLWGSGTRGGAPSQAAPSRRPPPGKQAPRAPPPTTPPPHPPRPQAEAAEAARLGLEGDRDALAGTTRRLRREVARLEGLRRSLLQQLHNAEEEGAASPGEEGCAAADAAHDEGSREQGRPGCDALGCYRDAGAPGRTSDQSAMVLLGSSAAAAGSGGSSGGASAADAGRRGRPRRHDQDGHGPRGAWARAKPAQRRGGGGGGGGGSGDGSASSGSDEEARQADGAGGATGAPPPPTPSRIDGREFFRTARCVGTELTPGALGERGIQSGKPRAWRMQSTLLLHHPRTPRHLPAPHPPHGLAPSNLCAPRSRLPPEGFASFLGAIKALNSGEATRRDALARARELFGARHADLYATFEALLSRHMPA